MYFFLNFSGKKKNPGLKIPKEAFEQPQTSSTYVYLNIIMVRWVGDTERGLEQFNLNPSLNSMSFNRF